jgi:hypothetical protein
VGRKGEGPGGGYGLAGGGGDAGEVVTEGVVYVAVGLGGLWLVLSDAVEVDDAIAEMEVVARKADGALDQDEVFWGWLQEDDDMKGTQWLGGAKVERSTRTWSPMSSVFSIEPEGISKFWKMNAWAKITKISSVQMEAMDSSGLSVCFCFSTMVGGDTLSVAALASCFFVWLTAVLLSPVKKAMAFPSPDQHQTLRLLTV